MATRPKMDAPLLRDLVESRIESIDVEYKRWMPLVEPIERAKIARHICALSNAGGGYLIFGFEDDGAASILAPDDLTPYNQDAINGIADRYLVPAPHCEVHTVEAASGQRHPVIRVPAHGEQPVCAKRDGPPDDRGRPQGIVRGVHYVRTAGPKSEPIITPELWGPVIRRCVFSERTSLLTSIGQLFGGSQPAPPGPEVSTHLIDDLLSDWTSTQCPAWPVSIADNRVAFAFRLLGNDRLPLTSIPIDQLLTAIRSASQSSSDDVRDGGTSFESRWKPDKRPFVTVVGPDEAYEARLIPDEGDRYSVPAIWRVTATGSGAEVMAFSEDNEWIRAAVEERSSRRWPAGKRFSPIFQIQHIAQRLAFVARLARSFPLASLCDVSFDFAGLDGRVLGDPFAGTYSSLDRVSRVDKRVASNVVETASLLADLPSATAALAGRITLLFDGWTTNADGVRNAIQRTS